jgi:uncharacterized membrane protein
MTTEQAVVSAISNVGFPIVAFLLMYRMSRETIKENTEALQNLKGEIKRSHARGRRKEE